MNLMLLRAVSQQKDFYDTALSDTLSFVKQLNGLNFTSVESAVQGALRWQQPSRSRSLTLFIESIIIENSKVRSTCLTLTVTLLKSNPSSHSAERRHFCPSVCQHRPVHTVSQVFSQVIEASCQHVCPITNTLLKSTSRESVPWSIS